MAEKLVHLGFEIPSGAPISIPIRHLCVSGQTQESGKTTTLAALISRAQLPALAFVTKRFENGFINHAGTSMIPVNPYIIEPFFRERADWQFVAAILEATMRERMKFQRSWIMKLCSRSKDWSKPESLADVLDNVKIALKTARGINEGVYTELKHYLELVVPQIEKLPGTRMRQDLDLNPGLNVMPLDFYTLEMQSLVIQSTLDWIYHNAENTITVIPEAWEFLPQRRGSPVKLSAEQLIRKGAAGKNYVWLDSQDLANVDANIRKSIVVWLLGVQREKNEVKRTLDHIAGVKKKPSADEIMFLKRGEFIVCYGDVTKKVYVQPTWLSEEKARKVAMGEAVYSLPAQSSLTRVNEDENMWKEKYDKLKIEFDDLSLRFSKLEKNPAMRPETPDRSRAVMQSMPVVETPENMFIYVRDRLRNDPEILDVLRSRPQINVHRERKTISLDDGTLRGRMAILISEGFYDSPKGNKDTLIELKRRGWDSAAPRVSEAFDWFTTSGFFVREGDTGVRAVKGMKINIVDAA